jgi:hypothetical protein
MRFQKIGVLLEKLGGQFVLPLPAKISCRNESGDT